MHISRPVIFFPGTQCDERVWLPVWRALDLAERCYVPLQWANSLDEMQALASDRITRYDMPVHLVGFSMGGYLASLTALQYPNTVASLTLVGYTSFGLTDEEVSQRKLVIQMINQRRYSGIGQNTLKNYVHPLRLEDPQVSGTVREMDQDLGGGVLKAHIEAATPRPDLTQRLAKAKFPVHIIAGEQDRIAPYPSIKKMHQQIPKSSLEILADTAHMLPLERPTELARILGYLLSGK